MPVELRGFQPLTFCMPCNRFRLTALRWVRLPQIKAVAVSGDVSLGPMLTKALAR
jgi:molybdenum cofactor biosynthesis enzyme MoaA